MARSAAMHRQTGGEVRMRRNVGLALRGVGLWHLAFGLAMVALALTMTDPEDTEAPFWILLGGIVVVMPALVLVGISWGLLGGGFFKSPWLLTLGAGLVGTLIEAVFIYFSITRPAPVSVLSHVPVPVPLVGVVLGLAAAYFIIDITLAGKSRGKQARAQDERALLARLRDKGLITDEEYESKRADLPSEP